MLGNAAAKLGSYVWKGQINAMNKLFKSLIASSALAAALTLLRRCAGCIRLQSKHLPRPQPRLLRRQRPPIRRSRTHRSKGLVWVNTSSKVYHKDGQFYGKTKQGKFMTEADAQKAGYRAAKDPAVGKKKPSPSKK